MFWKDKVEYREKVNPDDATWLRGVLLPNPPSTFWEQLTGGVLPNPLSTTSWEQQAVCSQTHCLLVQAGGPAFANLQFELSDIVRNTCSTL